MGAQAQNLLNQVPPRLALEVLILAVIILVSSIFLRRELRILVGIVVFFGSIAVIIGGTAILMNNVSLSGSPGPLARLKRFLTVDWAATSEHGDSAAACADPAQLAARGPVPIERAEHRPVRRAPAHTGAHSGAPPSSAAMPGAGAGAGAGAPTDFPELVRRAYPGIPPKRLMQLAAATVSSLPGWQLVSTDEKTLTVDAVYRTRLLGFDDDVRIIVTPRGEVDVCSRSRVGESGAQSPLRFFRGDFGANVGHIKEFYLALNPAVDEAYRQEEMRQTAAQHGVRP